MNGSVRVGYITEVIMTCLDSLLDDESPEVKN